MSQTSDRIALSREDREELASMAAAAARRNRPTHLVAAACVLLVGALAMAGSALLARQSAERALTRAASENVRAQALITEINRIRGERAGAQGPGAPTGVNDPFPNFGSRMGELATQAGLTVGIPQEQSRPSGALVRREYNYSINTPALDAVMNWIRRAMEEIPGTRVISVSITPQQATRAWTVIIKFARLERTAARPAP